MKGALQVNTKNPDTGCIVKVALGVIGGIVVLVLVLGAFVTIGAGQVGVVTKFGAVDRVLQPGLAFKIPVIEQVTLMETRIQKEQADASAASKDLQEVKSTIAMNYHIEARHAVEIYQNIGADYRVRIIDPALQEAFKAVTAKFTAEELIAKREQVKSLALDELKARLGPSNILVDEFNIVNFEFSKEFNAAIEQKQVAAQNVEKARRDLERITVEAEQALTQARGQANAQQALRDNGALSREYLDYLAVQKWNGVLPQVTGGASPFISIPAPTAAAGR